MKSSSINHKEKLAYEHVLGILPKTQYQPLQHDDEFISYVHYWENVFHMLEDTAPLKAQDKEKIWININRQVFSKKPKKNIFSFCLLPWQRGFSLAAVFIAMVGTGYWQFLTPNTNTSEWEFHANIESQTLNIKNIAHQHHDEKSTCVLWVKNDNQFHFISQLPETGATSIRLNSKLLDLIQKGEMVHSTESIASLAKKEIPKKPTKIDFIGHWKI